MIEVFIIDDSMLMRNIVKKVLKKLDNVQVIGEAANPIDAMNSFVKTGFPDLFILDIEMPKMDGLTFLKKLRDERPTPTIVFATMESNRSTKAIEAMELGACDIIVKPANMKNGVSKELEDEFRSKIEICAGAKSIHESIVRKATKENIEHSDKNVVAIGSSTGGVQTIEFILTNLKKDHPPIVITQHMPEGFTASFAKRLDKVCENSRVFEAKDKQKLRYGYVYIAPGNLHLEIKKISKGQYETVLKDTPKVSNHKPSVDVLFKSVAIEAKEKAAAFILTGMGKDGAKGIGMVKNAGGETYSQDEESAIVYGMPKVAYELGNVDKQVTLNEIIDIINSIKG